MSSENLSGAVNQQERPGVEQWVVGFVDGEGCFSVPILRNATTSLGWQVQPEFAVAQGARSVHVLHELEQFFGCGRVGVNRRHDDHRENMYRYSVRRLSDLAGRIIPFFEEQPLRTAKAEEFRKFASVVHMMASGLHLSVGIRPSVDAETTKGFALALGKVLESRDPKRVTVTMAKEQRGVGVAWVANGRVVHTPREQAQ